MHHSTLVSHAEISAGNDVIRTVMIEPAARVDSAVEPLTVVVGNGAFGGPRTFGRVMRQFVEAAAEDGVNATAVMHHDPYLGHGNYAESYRTERLARVTGNAASNGPVGIIGHSWSWRSALEIAEDSPEQVSVAIGYTPTGHQKLKPGGAKWHDLFLNAAREARHPKIISSIGSLGSGIMVARDMAVRFPTPTGRSETINSFDANATGKVLDLRHDQQLPIGILVAERDEFFHPTHDAFGRLSEAGVVMRSIPTTHIGAVTRHHFGNDLYRLAADLDLQHK